MAFRTKGDDVCRAVIFINHAQISHLYSFQLCRKCKSDFALSIAVAC